MQQTAGATVRYVDVNSTHPAPPYNNWSKAATNIQDAVDIASSGDEVLVNDGVYYTAARFGGSGTNCVVVNLPIVVVSVNGPEATRIDGQGSSRCVYLAGGATLSGFTLTNGTAPSGGGVYCATTNSLIANCVFLGNTATNFGGGVYQGSLTNCLLAGNTSLTGGAAAYSLLTDCQLNANSSAKGGGAFASTLRGCVLSSNFYTAGSLMFGGGAFYSTLSDCLLTGNLAEQSGGGAANSTLSNCVLAGNRTTEGEGGGAYVSTLLDCVLSNNIAAFRGGNASRSDLTNCLLTGGSATWSGGARECTLQNCTVAGNSASVSAGGIDACTANDSIVYYNTAPSEPNFSASTLNTSCTTPLPTNGVGNITAPPRFVNQAGGDYHLQATSFAINSGDNGNVTAASDLDGHPRIVDGTVDLGAYEYQQLLPAAFTAPATEVRAEQATLNGFALPNGQPTSAWFEWGERGTFSQSTPPVAVGVASHVIWLQAPISNLVAGIVYQGRLVASNAVGVAYGAPQPFTTAARLRAWGYSNAGQTNIPDGLRGNSVTAMAGGGYFTVALLASGRVQAWGENVYGQTDVPVGISNVIAVAAGEFHALALQFNGTVVAWGDDTYGATNVPSGLSNVVAIAAGGNHCLALRSDGTVVAWGRDSDGQTDVPVALSNVVAVAGGRYHSVALRADGTVVNWGRTNENQTSLPSNITHVAAIAAGGYHNLALRTDGTTRAWGYNQFNETVAPDDATNLVSVACGLFHNVALRNDGTVRAWWYDNYGESSVPPGLSNVVLVAAGFDHSLATVANHPPQAGPTNASAVSGQELVLHLFGSDPDGDPVGFQILSLPEHGTLYQYDNGVRGSPVTLSNSVVSDSAGRVVFVGDFSDVPDAFSFVADDGLTDSAPASVSLDIRLPHAPFAHTQPADHTTTNSTVLNGMATPNGLDAIAWFEWGERGGSTATTGPVTAGNGFGVVRVSTAISNLLGGHDYQCRLVVSNALGIHRGIAQCFAPVKRVQAWGDNGYGQTNLPPGLGNVVALDGGGLHSVVLRADGTVAAWGYDGYGETDVPSGLSNVIAVSAGYYHSLALKADGTVVAWGSHFNRSTGQPATPPAGLSNVVAIAGGGSHSVALKADGGVAAWGYNYFGQTNVPPGLSNVVAVACGYEHSLALKDDGTVVGWGDNEYGQTNVPAGLTNVVAVAAGHWFSLAVKDDGSVIAWGNDDHGQTNVPAGLTNVVLASGGTWHGLAMDDQGKVTTWGLGVPGPNTVPDSVSNAVAASAGGSHDLALVDNSPPEALAQTITGPANNDLIITLQGTDRDADLLSFRIALPATAGTLYQYVAGERGAVIASTDTVVSDSLGRVIFVPATNSFDSPYSSLSFVADDGNATSAPASVTINIEGRAYAHTLAPTGLTPAGAVFNGVTVPNGFDSTAWFEWGEPGNFVNRTPPVPAGNGLVVVPVSAVVYNLPTTTTLECRLVVSNAAGVRFGFPQLFATRLRARLWGNYNVDGETNIPAGLGGLMSLATGSGHTLALKRDGTVVGWGFNNYGQTIPPTGLSNVIRVAAGNIFSLALKSDHTVTAWGQDEFDLGMPPGLSNITDIAAGPTLALAIKPEGRILGWGDRGQPELTNYPPTLSNVVMVAAGSYHGLALKADGTITAWGYGVNNLTNVPPAASDCVAVAAGTAHSLALRSDGTVVGWGSNTKGAATPPAGLSNVVAIAAHGDVSFALKHDGTIVAWGDNSYGQQEPPPGLEHFVKVSPADDFTAALVTNTPPVAASQSVTGFGNSDLVIPLSGNDVDGDVLSYTVETLPLIGTLYQYAGGGRGTAITTNGTPVMDDGARVVFVPQGGEVGQDYASFEFTAFDGDAKSALGVLHIDEVARLDVFTSPASETSLTNARLNGFVSPHGFNAAAWFEWGTNTSYGRSTTPVNVMSNFGVLQVSQPITGVTAGQVIHFRLIASNATQIVQGPDQRFVTGGRLTAWGDNSSGQSSVPANQGAVVSVTGGFSHSLALRADGTVLAWGNNAYGQTTVPGLPAVASLAAGGFHNVALLADGRVVAWGRNNAGQTNVPPSATNIVAVAAGGQHSLALRDDGSLVAWGDNSQGQRNVPAGLTNVVGIAAGWYHNVALRGDGTVTAWGANNYGQSSVPEGVSNVVWVGAGLYHSLALRHDGTLVAWGLNSSSQTNVPAAFTNVVAAACGGSHNLMLAADDTFAGWGYNYFGQALPPAAISNVVLFAAGGSHSLALMPGQAPFALNQVVAGYPDKDLLITLAGASSSGSPLTYRIISLPEVGLLYQCNNGARGPQITSTNIIVADANQRVIFVPAEHEIGNPYAAFDFVANDGAVDSDPASVTVNIVLPVVPVMDVTGSGLSTNGEFRIVFSGTSNATYRVWASTNLLDWEALGTAETASPGSFFFLDPAATNWPQRFYRVTAP
ncbi:MAG TPA: choice-of-anchor Q domain-containing protein [Verrucomicrobiae bacterium]|nr:choice-of-anchor Q domain-containing protein [Verrucomicrobiae bacterium]